jgi:putative oxidoreductase
MACKYSSVNSMVSACKQARLRSTGLAIGRASLFATAAGLSESSGGLLLAAGLVTPLAAAAIVSVMFAAALSSHLKNGFWITNGGYEYTLTLGLVAMGIGFIGPGSYSLDHLLGWTLSGRWWGLLAFAVALAATIPIEAYRRERIQAITANHQSTSAAG